MAVYAIGDVQGCYDELMALLEQVEFDSAHDTLWLVGDLVNRGPKSLEVLRFVKGLGDRAVAVLGNHDLNLLAIDAGKRRQRKRDTVDDVLDAPDRIELLSWLRHLPLVHHDARLGYTLVHAGLPPQWTIEAATKHAGEVQTVLRGPDYRSFLGNMYGNKPDMWSKELTGAERLRFITNSLTRIRYCTAGGRLNMAETGAPGSQPAGDLPWFEIPERASVARAIIFGHWATLQTEQRLNSKHGVYHLDTGCVWGGKLTALRLDDQRYFAFPSLNQYALRNTA